jgi:hypothetical protein
MQQCGTVGFRDEALGYERQEAQEVGKQVRARHKKLHVRSCLQQRSNAGL